MRGWIKLGAVVWALCGGTAWAADQTAGAVQSRCQAGQKAGCVALFDGFLAGYLTGVQKGVRSTFSNDPQVLQTTDGNDDTYRRYRDVVERTVCLQSDKDGTAAMAIFLNYLGANPDTADQPFGDVMEVALDAAWACPGGGKP